MITKFKKAFMYGYSSIGYRLVDRKPSKKLKYITDTLSKLPSGASVLNLGCGDGNLEVHTNKNRKYSFTSIDIEPRAIEELRSIFTRFPKAHDTAIVGDITNLEALIPNKNQYDVVISWRVLHGINPKDYPKVFTNIKNILKPGGRFYISVACDQDWKVEALKDKFDPRGINDCSGVMFHNYNIDRDHVFPIHFFSLEELSKLGKETGFSLLSTSYFQESSGYTHLKDKLNTYLFAEFTV